MTSFGQNSSVIAISIKTTARVTQAVSDSKDNKSACQDGFTSVLFLFLFFIFTSAGTFSRRILQVLKKFLKVGCSIDFPIYSSSPNLRVSEDVFNNRVLNELESYIFLIPPKTGIWYNCDINPVNLLTSVCKILLPKLLGLYLRNVCRIQS